MFWTRVALFGILYCGLAVALGAFGAHALKARLSEYALGVFETGVRYQFYHGLGLLALSLLAERHETLSLRIAAYLMIGGVLVFSGSLYTLALSSQKWWGAIAPIGGSLLLGGWLSFALGVLGRPAS